MFRIRMRSYGPIGICLAFLLVASGCQDGNPPTYRVLGKVTFADGSPQRGGEVIMESQKFPGVEARGPIGEDGSFELTTFEPNDGAVAGEHIVIVLPKRRHSEGGRRYEYTIDDKYLDFDRSGLRCTVVEQEAANQCTLVVTPPAVRDE